ncbi:MAG: hypothetical protein AB7D38_09935 [Sulfurimonas sp.]|uniref:hypothetical protein n=1 Tax=Sulfurimonas sp. TaxID=2022749 RepID=UPI003D0FFA61
MDESQDINRLEQVFDAKIGLIEHRFDSLSREMINIKEQNERETNHLEEKINLKIDLLRQMIQDIEKHSAAVKEDKKISLTQWGIIITAGALILNLIVNFFGITYQSVKTNEAIVKEQKK